MQRPVSQMGINFIGRELADPNSAIKRETRYFLDTIASKSEILFRRIGKNELVTIAVVERS